MITEGVQAGSEKAPLIARRDDDAEGHVLIDHKADATRAVATAETVDMGESAG